jgi:hypothetical protein
MMEVSYIVLAFSVVVNLVLVYAVYSKTGVSAVQALNELKAAVIKFKAARDKASVDAVAYAAQLPQILELLNNK